jgi:hydroxymethylpyrimidine/phosphomethylpyrimidine kinase
MKTVLTVAGSDSSGGAGIQADIKTVTVHGLFAMSAITALTAQNTTGVYGIHSVPAEFVKKQLDCVFTDIFPDAVKIGMLSDESVAEAVFERLTHYRAKNIVLDPVMVSTSGSRLLTENAEKKLTALFSIASVVTPNIPEAEVLCGMKISNKDDMRRAAIRLSKEAGCAVLVKGGHLIESGIKKANDDDEIKIDGLFENDEVFECGILKNKHKIAFDCLAENDLVTWFLSERVDNPNTHGTGCTLSSAIACGLADGKSLKESVAAAKKYLVAALNAKLNLGKGRGPLNHMIKP